MAARPHYVILGGGLAAHGAAEALRGSGFDGRVTLVSDESQRPYDRTPLSKAVLQRQREIDDIFLQSADSYEQHDIELLLGARADSVDFDSRIIQLNSGDSLQYEKLLIATGARPRRLSGPGFDLAGIHYLRTIDDAHAIRTDAEHAQRVLVVGGGFIGSEVAASLRVLGKEVVLVDVVSLPLAAALGETAGRLCAEIHRDQGIDMRLENRVREFKGDGYVRSAVLESGEEIDIDLAVIGAGVIPNTDLFINSPLEIDNGIRVDQYCETSVPGVYAAGDIANFWHPGLERPIRVEHFDNAASQGAAAGQAMTEQGEPFAPVPYFWSDQYDTNIQYAGYPGSGYQEIVRGSFEDRKLTVFYLESERVRAVVTINQPRDLRPGRRMITAGVPVDPKKLADPGVDMRKYSREIAARST